MKVAICDDDPYITERINELLTAYDSSMFEVVLFYNPLKLIRQIEKESFDFYLLDIEMEPLNGVELAKVIREKGILSPIVFLTSYKEYMEEVFQVQTFDYLLKPIDAHAFNRVLNRLKLHIGVSSEMFVFSINKKTIKIPMQNIHYFEKNKRQVIIYTVNGIYTPYMTTTEIKEQLNTDFVQIHSSIIIHTNFVKELGHHYLLLNVNQESVELPISRKYKDTSRQQILLALRRKVSC